MDFVAIQDAFSQVFLDWRILATIVAAAFYGIFMGAVPGLTATMAVALLIPLTYTQPTLFAFAAVVTLVACAIFSGDIPTTLVRMPGTPSSAAYAEDAHALAMQGRARQTLGVALAFSVIGGIFGALVLMFLARPLARIAVGFTYYEYFWLYVLGLSCAAIVSRGSALKGALALGLGLGISTIGLGTVYSTARFAGDSAALKGGIEFIPAMVGLFGVSEILRGVLRSRSDLDAATLPPSVKELSDHGTFAEVKQRLLRRPWHTLRSTSIGSLIGMLPGAGADIAAWVSLAASRRFSKRRDSYGRGSLDGIADATAANNSAIAGAWIPALVFGIPGDSVTALVISVLYMKKIVPGPDIFENPEQRTLVYSIYLLFIAANLVLIPLGLLAIRAGTTLVRLPQRILLPCVLLFTIVGSFAFRATYFDVGVMLVMGLLGFVLDRHKVPLGPVVLGLVLGGPLEEKLIQGLIASNGSILAFFSRPVAGVLGVTTIALWLSPTIFRTRRRSREPRP